MRGQALLKEIELCRNRMVSLASNSSYSNKEVVKISKELDVLLNQYHHLLQNKK